MTLDPGLRAREKILSKGGGGYSTVLQIEEVLFTDHDK